MSKRGDQELLGTNHEAPVPWEKLFSSTAKEAPPINPRVKKVYYDDEEHTHVLPTFPRLSIKSTRQARTVNFGILFLQSGPPTSCTM